VPSDHFLPFASHLGHGVGQALLGCNEHCQEALEDKLTGSCLTPEMLSEGRFITELLADRTPKGVSNSWFG